MRGALLVDPLPRDPSDITALGALAFDQPRDLLLAAVRHRVQFGMRNGPTVSRIGARSRLNASPSVVAVILPSRPSAFAIWRNGPLWPCSTPTLAWISSCARMPATRILSAITGETRIS